MGEPKSGRFFPIVRHCAVSAQSDQDRSCIPILNFSPENMMQSGLARPGPAKIIVSSGDSRRPSMVRVKFFSATDSDGLCDLVLLAESRSSRNVEPRSEQELCRLIMYIKRNGLMHPDAIDKAREDVAERSTFPQRDFDIAIRQDSYPEDRSRQPAGHSTSCDQERCSQYSVLSTLREVHDPPVPTIR